MVHFGLTEYTKEKTMLSIISHDMARYYLTVRCIVDPPLMEAAICCHVFLLSPNPIRIQGDIGDAQNMPICWLVDQKVCPQNGSELTKANCWQYEININNYQ